MQPTWLSTRSTNTCSSKVATIDIYSSSYLSAHFDNETRNRICIDSAQDLINFDDILENRDKVEQLCLVIQLKPYAERFAGFVDREFREFDLSAMLSRQSKMSSSFRTTGMVKGTFCRELLLRLLLHRKHPCCPICPISAIRYQISRLKLLGEQFQTIVRIACAMSLTGKDTKSASTDARKHQYANLENRSVEGRHLIWIRGKRVSRRKMSLLGDIEIAR